MPQKPQMHEAISSSLVKQIDENLRRIYAPKLAEEIPEHLHALLKQLREKETPI